MQRAILVRVQSLYWVGRIGQYSERIYRLAVTSMLEGHVLKY